MTTLKVREGMGKSNTTTWFEKMTFNKGQQIYWCTTPFDFEGCCRETLLRSENEILKIGL